MLGYWVQVEHPHKFLLHYIKVLDGSIALAQRSWNFLNDMLIMDLCIKYPPEALAVAAISLSARFLRIPLPNNPKWHLLFEVDERKLMAIIEAVGKLYLMPKPDYSSLSNPFLIETTTEISVSKASHKSPSLQGRRSRSHSPRSRSRSHSRFRSRRSRSRSPPRYRSYKSRRRRSRSRSYHNSPREQRYRIRHHDRSRERPSRRR
jgi:hypothetical protein